MTGDTVCRAGGPGHGLRHPVRYVGVVGPANATPEEVALAVEVGRLLAKEGVVVVTGGLGGVMAGAARGCAEEGGTSIGLLPGEDRDAANPHLTLTVPTGMGEMRNALLVRSCDVLIGVGNSWGTLSEIALALRTGVPVLSFRDASLFAELEERDGGRPLMVENAHQAVGLSVELLGLASREDAVDPTGGAYVLGVDRARRSWVGALLPRSGVGAMQIVSAPDIDTLIHRAGAHAELELVGVDIPIGLPDLGPRQADRLARARLGPRRSSVFATPIRDAVQATTYKEARTVSTSLSGRSVSAQAYYLREAILDVDAYVRRSEPTLQVLEVHPELSFAVMAGAPLEHSKKTAEGARTRAGLLVGQGIELPADLDLNRTGADDILDAAAVAWSVSRIARGVAERLPREPERFSDGLDAAIWV
ncbi:TIGR00725 family protein [Ornithinimicrobium sp. Y1694]|uniref:TIGR00725 family protein n=1 Tax=Ornithinimicrobium sp. Y1694 TaxID=3418590 RepID=UPI003CF1DDC4